MLPKILKHYADIYETPLNLFSSTTFINAYKKLSTYLPMAKHYYALKALPLADCVKSIKTCNGFIDVATIGEMKLVQQTAPSLLRNCIYTHPIKNSLDIETALSLNIETMVADNIWELKKLLPYKKRIKLLLRIAFPNEEAKCNLSKKFGATLNETKELLNFCILNDLNVLGCSFHVGSQMPNPAMHLKAISECKILYDWVYKEFGYRLNVLDIGGGFPSTSNTADLEEYCAPICQLLNEQFSNVEIYTEPGRCIANDALINIAQIEGKALKGDVMWYYINDGVYGTYSGNIYDHNNKIVQPLEKNKNIPLLSIFSGPTCDSIDVLNSIPIAIPELEIGDYVYTTKIGAYSIASKTNFNFVKDASIITVAFDFNNNEALIHKKKKKECLLMED